MARSNHRRSGKPCSNCFFWTLTAVMSKVSDMSEVLRSRIGPCYLEDDSESVSASAAEGISEHLQTISLFSRSFWQHGRSVGDVSWRCPDRDRISRPRLIIGITRHRGGRAIIVGNVLWGLRRPTSLGFPGRKQDIRCIKRAMA